MGLTNMNNIGSAVKLCLKVCGPHPYLHQGEIETVMIYTLTSRILKNPGQNLRMCSRLNKGLEINITNKHVINF